MVIWSIFTSIESNCCSVSVNLLHFGLNDFLGKIKSVYFWKNSSVNWGGNALLFCVFGHIYHKGKFFRSIFKQSIFFCVLQIFQRDLMSCQNGLHKNYPSEKIACIVYFICTSNLKWCPGKCHLKFSAACLSQEYL